MFKEDIKTLFRECNEDEHIQITNKYTIFKIEELIVDNKYLDLYNINLESLYFNFSHSTIDLILCNKETLEIFIVARLITLINMIDNIYNFIIVYDDKCYSKSCTGDKVMEAQNEVINMIDNILIERLKGE